jgi:hypothetical protein
LASSHVFFAVKLKSSAFESATIIHNPRHHHMHMSRYPVLWYKSCKSIDSSFLSRELTFHALWISDSWLGECGLTFYSRLTTNRHSTEQHSMWLQDTSRSLRHVSRGIPSGMSNSAPRYVGRKRRSWKNQPIFCT